MSRTRMGRVLVVAATDSSGGAGLSRDLETLGELGLGSAVAVTAVTVQTDAAVERISRVAPKLVARQMRAALASPRVAAIKIGLLAGAETVREVAGVLEDHPMIPAVLDPVIGSTSGTRFLDDRAVRALLRALMPICRLATPNLPELAILAGGAQAGGEDAAAAQARALCSIGARAVLIKGGHAGGDKAVDILVDGDSPPVRIEAPRIARSVRGTGCMLSTAIAAHLAMGAPLADACRKAKVFVTGKIAAEAEGAGGG